MLKSMERKDALAIVVCAELLIGVFLEHVQRATDECKGSPRTPYELLIERDEGRDDGGFVVQTLLEEKIEENEEAVEELLGAVGLHELLSLAGRSASQTLKEGGEGQRGGG